jgi:hypothetical protein
VWLLIFFPWISEAHEGEKHEIETTDHVVEILENGVTVELRLEEQKAKVGQLVTLRGSLRQQGQLLPNQKVRISFFHLEDEVVNFQTEFSTRSGEFVWRQQFFDGAPHRVEVVFTAEEGGPERACHMNIEVEAVQPPLEVILRSLLFLVSVVAFFMAVGYVLALKF